MRGVSQEKTQMLERMGKDVTVGMTFGEDLKSGKGVLLIARSQELTPALRERMRNFSAELGHSRARPHAAPKPALVCLEAAPAAHAPIPAVCRA